MSQGDKRYREENSTEEVTFIPPMELDSAAKKPRMDEGSVQPSKVIHLRNLPDNATDKEVMMLGLPFGRVVNILLLRSKNQAFIEMADASHAASMLSYYATVPATIRDKNVFMQYSKHQELKVQQTPNQSVGTTSTNLGPPSMSGGASPSGGAAYTMDPASPQSQPGVPHSVLRVIIENMLYPITIDVLHQIFSKYGSILRIVTFVKNSQFHALLQYPDAITATTAKTALDGQNIYNGCCTLRIDFSKLSSLTVKFNNEKTRDFTRPDLPSGEQADVSSSAAGAGGASSGVPDLTTAIASIPPALLQNPGGGVVMSGCVVLVSNLNEKMITPHALFILFGVYGDVIRVKILYNKRDSALIQFKEPQHAQTAIANLNGVALYGKKLHVTHSKHAQVQMPQAGSTEDSLTEDYNNSPLHRFKKPGSKNYQNIFPPSATLHLSNIPDCIDEEYIKTLFASTGGGVQNFRFFQNDRRMALIQMASVEEAVSALIAMHNYKISESNHLRVSFSKNPIS